MAVTVVATPKASNANSYATLAESNTYHEAHPYSTTWDDAGTDERNRALVTATRMLDLWFDWHGESTTLTQALLWPRRGVLKPGVSSVEVPDIVTNNWHEPFGVLLDQDVVPVLIRDATCELARHLLASDRTADSDIQTQGIEALSAGPVSLRFKASVEAKPIPDAVMVMCSKLGIPRSRTGSGGTRMYRS